MYQWSKGPDDLAHVQDDLALLILHMRKYAFALVETHIILLNLWDKLSKELSPAGIQRWNDVDSTLFQRCVSTWKVFG